MTGVPIDKDAMKVAKGAVDDLYERKSPSSARGGEDVELAVSTYLEAVGAEVEIMRPDPRSGTRFVPQSRLRTPWKPLTDTQKFETEEAMRFGPRSYTGEQQAVIDQAVAERKPLSAPPLTDTGPVEASGDVPDEAANERVARALFALYQAQAETPFGGGRMPEWEQLPDHLKAPFLSQGTTAVAALGAASRVPDEQARMEKAWILGFESRARVARVPDEARKRAVEDALEDVFDNGQGMDVERLAERAIAAYGAASRVPSAPGDSQELGLPEGELLYRCESCGGLMSSTSEPLCGVCGEIMYAVEWPPRFTGPSSSAPEQVERAAKLICETVWHDGRFTRGGLSYDPLPETEKEGFRAQARGVLDAMSGPPETSGTCAFCGDLTTHRLIGEWLCRVDQAGFREFVNSKNAPSGPSDERWRELHDAADAVFHDHEESADSTAGRGFDRLGRALDATATLFAGPPESDERGFVPTSAERALVGQLRTDVEVEREGRYLAEDLLQHAITSLRSIASADAKSDQARWMVGEAKRGIPKGAEPMKQRAAGPPTKEDR